MSDSNTSELRYNGPSPMQWDALLERDADDSLGRQLYGLVTELYPICRSITGDGVRRSLQLLSKSVPLELHEVPSGTPVFDWTVPREWNIRDAYLKDSSGTRLVDFQQHNLSVVSYSTPIHRTLTLDELRPHLFTLPDYPDWIPYRTSYYRETWGLCLPHRTLLSLRADEEYEVCIDADLSDGHLTYGEYYVPGSSTDEVLISCHCCHPSLCNDNLSSMAVAISLAKRLSQMALRYSYRFLFIPGTIGSITWLARNESRTPQITHGLVLANLGDAGQPTYKKSRRGNAEIDHAVVHVLEQSGSRYDVREFSPYGYDERQFCSPGFNLPVGRLTRTPHGEYPEYHTSADNLTFVTPDALSDSLSVCGRILFTLEHNRTYLNQNPRCEPQLGKRGLYRAMGGTDSKSQELAMLWVLNLSDGSHSLLDIAERAHLPFKAVHDAAGLLLEHSLLIEQRAAPQPLTKDHEALTER